MDARDYATIEDRIAAAEEILTMKRTVIESPEVSTNAARLQAALVELETAQTAADDLYTRWAELEAKQWANS